MDQKRSLHETPPAPQAAEARATAEPGDLMIHFRDIKNLCRLVVLAFLLLGLALLVLGCEKGEPVQDKPRVDFLAEVEGCRVYRMIDGLTPVYFTNCPGRAQCDTGGKGSRRVQNVTSLNWQMNELPAVNEIPADDLGFSSSGYLSDGNAAAIDGIEVE